MNTELTVAISKEEIDWVRSKHAGIVKSARRILTEAMEIGQWFVEADERMGFKKNPKGHRSREWRLWLGAHFPEMHVRTIEQYMRLAEGRDYLEKMVDDQLRIDSQSPPSITRALRLLRDRDRQEKEDQEPDLPPAEFEEPLLILRDQLKSYVYQQFQVQYLAEQIRFRIKNAKLGRRQIRQAVEWATQDHPELRDMVLKTFLP